jgi:hypothetical protein
VAKEEKNVYKKEGNMDRKKCVTVGRKNKAMMLIMTLMPAAKWSTTTAHLFDCLV